MRALLLVLLFVALCLTEDVPCLEDELPILSAGNKVGRAFFRSRDGGLSAVFNIDKDSGTLGDITSWVGASADSLSSKTHRASTALFLTSIACSSTNYYGFKVIIKKGRENLVGWVAPTDSAALDSTKTPSILFQRTICPRPEECDNIDNDCDGMVDEDLQKACWPGLAESQRNVGACKDGSQTCSSGLWSFCRGYVLPSMERCDNVDNDCDGKVDEDLRRPCYSADPATQGKGVCKNGYQSCEAGQWGQCVEEVTPGLETCDGRDNDCDGLVDEDIPPTECYTGRPATLNVGECKAGTRTCTKGRWGDCKGDVRPSEELCDGLDNDCDGTVDNFRRACYEGDRKYVGKGACKAGTQLCTAGTWGACEGQVLPVKEVCGDRIDNDCNGKIDDGCNRP